MATLRTRVRSDGTTAYLVRVYNSTTKGQVAFVFESEHEATTFINW